MSTKHYDIIIIGSGIAGLYSAYTIKQKSPETSFLILEKYKKHWIGGRMSNDTFYNTEIVTGAGIGRKSKDKLLLKLIKDLDIPTNEFTFQQYYSQLIHPVNIKKIMTFLRKEYKKYENENKNENKSHTTCKHFAKELLGEKEYKKFILSIGYSDYENEDVFDTLYSYGMDDNTSGWIGIKIPWKNLILQLCNIIGFNNIKTSNNVIKISVHDDSNSIYVIHTNKNINYTCNKIIIATTIESIKKLLPTYHIYNQIQPQPFLRLYGKFSKISIPILKQYIKGYTIVPGPLQKILPVDADNGVYMIAYCDNNNALILKDYLKNTQENRELFCELIEKSLDISPKNLHLIAIKDYYWPIGTHYYKPLQSEYKNRLDFINKAQHPEKNILIVGEVVAENQGWTEGALESVNKVLTSKWINL